MIPVILGPERVRARDMEKGTRVTRSTKDITEEDMEKATRRVTSLTEKDTVKATRVPNLTEKEKEAARDIRNTNTGGNCRIWMCRWGLRQSLNKT